MCVIVVLVMVAIRKKQSRQIVAGMYIRTYRYTLNVHVYLSMACLILYEEAVSQKHVHGT